MNKIYVTEEDNLDQQNQNQSSNIVNKEFIKTATFWIRLVLIACLTAGWIYVIEQRWDVTDIDRHFLNKLPNSFVQGNACTPLLDILPHVRPVYLGISITGWILSIAYIVLNFFNIQRHFKGFSLRILFRVLDGIMTLIMTILCILMLTVTILADIASRLQGLEGLFNYLCIIVGNTYYISLPVATALAFIVWLLYLTDIFFRCCPCCGKNSGKF